MIKLKLSKKKQAAETTSAAEEGEAAMEKKVNSLHAPKKILTDLRYGRSLSVDFFRKNAWLLILIVVLTLSLMGLRYNTKMKMKEINKLENALLRARSEKLREKSQYMTLIRESEMHRLVQQKGLGLEFQEDPAYTVAEVSDEELK
ncbi:MAG: FtsL-like putative cell division protein [Muribaculum sp.]|nr:FtsL-like putative cell division protein [Muribaculum sp.]